MTNYLLVRNNPENEELSQVWNYRTGQWQSRVTNSCRYRGRQSRRKFVGIVPPKHCEDQQLRFFNGEIEVEILAESYIREDFYGQLRAKGLEFED